MTGVRIRLCDEDTNDFTPNLLSMLQDISNQVAGYMRDPSRMVKQMQLRRSAVNVFGSVSHFYL